MGVSWVQLTVLGAAGAIVVICAIGGLAFLFWSMTRKEDDDRRE